MTLVPFIAAAGELKTKPTQHSVRQLMELGIQPDVLLCRTERALPIEARRKIAHFCNVDVEAVFEARDVQHLYEIPLAFAAQGLDDLVCKRLGLETAPSDLSAWVAMTRRAMAPARGRVRIVVVGKYTATPDAYKSIKEALLHGGIASDVGVDIDWVEAETLEGRDAAALDAWVSQYGGVLVPGGFGRRGFEGKVAAIGAARRTGVPFLGICLGLQAAVVEFARHVAGLAGAHSTEFAVDAPHPVVCLMDVQRHVTTLGGTMRLGSYPTVLSAGTRAAEAYNALFVHERHRHRYEVNPAYIVPLCAAGLCISGMSPDRTLVEMVELADHPWFVATQAHPELRSRPMMPHPLFVSFIRVAMRRTSSAQVA